MRRTDLDLVDTTYLDMSDKKLPFWDAGFDQPIILHDGTKLRTLHETAAFLDRHFEGRRGVQYTGAMLTLSSAARTGAGAEIHDARLIVEILLRGQKLL
ncbi:MAG: hypothetical protein K0R27_3791 [Xanthobacteraceae bacterium]|jgi:hypothetical protein|nr:hypothetical protein [Xanthobacteraceae bacterium]